MDDWRPALISQVATLFAFKIATSILIVWFFPSWEAIIVVLALSVPWIVGAAWYFGIITHVRYRLLRVRAKRRRLIYQEWHVDEPATPPSRRR